MELFNDFSFKEKKKQIEKMTLYTPFFNTKAKPKVPKMASELTNR